MINRNSHKKLAPLLVAVIAIATTVTLSSPAQAACSPIKPTGKTVGKISIGSVALPIKSFNYPIGGVMEPVKNTTAAGLSERHMPLSSEVGSSVLLWHRDYRGCIHPLNLFMDKKVGTQFTLTDENGADKKYRLSYIKVIKKGQYQESWFNLIGPRQIVMFTCTGVFKSGHYEKNMVFIATPI